jgi:hypothetical protein
MAGKGSKRRPLSVPTDTFNGNWDNIFRKAVPKPEEVKPIRTVKEIKKQLTFFS